MRNRNASENDLVFIKNRSFSTGKIFNLMQRKHGVAGKNQARACWRARAGVMPYAAAKQAVI